MIKKLKSLTVCCVNNKPYHGLIWMVGLAGVTLLAWSLWPLPSASVNFTLSSMFLDGGLVELAWPAVVQRGGAEKIQLSVDTTGLLIEIETTDGPALILLSDLAADFNTVFEARLEFSGSEIIPSGAVRVPFAPGQQVDFDWLVIPRQGGALKGTIWLYLELVPVSSNEETAVVYPVLARSLEIESRSLLGLGVFGVRGVGGALILICLSLLWFSWKKN